MTDVKRNEHMLPIANWLRDQINETLSRYDIPSDVYDTDTLIDALCVCAVDRSQAALRARLETVEKRGKVLEQWWKIADDGRIEAETRADLATHATMRCAECDCEKGGADCNWIATPTPAMCCLGLTPEQCAHTPSSQCEGLRPAVNPLDDPRVKALVEALRHEREMVCQDFDMQSAAARAVDAALSALEENK